MSIILEDKEYLSGSKTFLNRMRILGQYCDTVLGTEDGGMFRVHKAIMSCCSSYFRTLFKTFLGGKHCGDGPSTRTIIIIPEVSADILEIIIDYAYSGETLMTVDNVDYLYVAADQFNIQVIVEKCTDFILSNISTENCLGIWRFGKFYASTPLELESFEFILVNFTTIVKESIEFFNLPVDELKSILKDDSLNIHSELLAWNAVKHWIKQKPSCRIQYISELLPFVRLPVTQPTDLLLIINDVLLAKNTKVSPYIKLAVQHVFQELTDTLEPDATVENESQFIPRLPHEVLICCSGIANNEETNIFEVYDCRADAWKTVEVKYNLPTRLYHQCVSLGKCIYTLGGNEDSEYINSCYRFDTLKMVCDIIAPMNEIRCYHSATELAGKIYVFGGFNGNIRSNTAERYTPATNQWTYIATMHKSRSDAGACHVRNRIFVVGGYDGIHYLQSAEVYDVELDQWHLLPEMLSCRAAMGCVALNDCIYAVGGSCNGMNVRSVEKYSVAFEQWFVGKPMNTPRSNFGIQVLESKIYVVGGYCDEGDFLTNECEMFDPTVCRWQTIASMKNGRTAFGVCVLTHLKNIRDYTLSNVERCRMKRKDQEVAILEDNEQNDVP